MQCPDTVLVHSPSTFWTKWWMSEVCEQSVRLFCRHLLLPAVIGNNKCLLPACPFWPQTPDINAVFFLHPSPPLIGYFSFSGSSSVEHRSSCDVLKNPSWSAFCDTLTCSPIWHQQQCSTHSKWLKSFFFLYQTDAGFEHGHMPECTESLLCNWHNTSVCSHALRE